METERPDVKAQRRQASAQVLERLRAQLPAILSRYAVDAAYVFGSVARGTATPLSDVDVALLLSGPLPPYERLRLELAVEAAIEDALEGHSTDVRAIDEAPLMVRGRIVQEGVLVYEGDRAHRVRFEVQTRKQYFDFAPTAHHLRDVFLRHLHRKGLLRG